MKKIVCFFIASLVLVLPLSLTGCGGAEDNATDYEYNIYMPDGATALSMSYMMQFPSMSFYSDDGQADSSIKTAKINYNVVPVSTIASYVQSEKGDFVVLPVNAAVGLYNQGAKYKIAAVLTHGNLFMVGADLGDGYNLDSLKGKVVAAIGKGAIPELVLRYILTGSGIEVEESDTAVSGKVALTFAADGEYAIGLLQGGKADATLIAEPAVTNAVNKLGFKQLFDIQEEWEDLTGLSGYPQAALMIKDGVNPDFASEFLRLLNSGNGWVDDNTTAAVNLAKANALEGTEVSLPAISAAVAKRCNIFAQTEGLKTYIDTFYNAVSLAPGMTPARPKNDGVYYSA